MKKLALNFHTVVLKNHSCVSLSLYFLFLGTFFFALNWKLDIHQSKNWNLFHVGQNWKANAKKKWKWKPKKTKKPKKGFKTFSVKSKRLLIPPKWPNRPKIIIHNIKQHCLLFCNKRKNPAKHIWLCKVVRDLEFRWFCTPW